MANANNIHGIHGTEPLPGIDAWRRNIFANYSGSDRKDGVIAPNGDRYMIKYAEDHTSVNALDTSYVNNAISEYMSSHILGIIGYDVHETFLASRQGELVVACRDFTDESTLLIEFAAYMRKHYDSKAIGRVPSLEQIRFVLSQDADLSRYHDAFYRDYAERYVGDALVGNFDRHMGNWGYLVSRKDMRIKPAPVYDNGSTLFPNLPDRSMGELLGEPREIAKRALLFPTSALTIRPGGPKVGYADMLASGYDPVFSRAVIGMVPRIRAKMPEINGFIDAQRFMSDTRRAFYKQILKARLELILLPALSACMSGRYDDEARRRIDADKGMTEALFDEKYNALLKP